MVCVSILLPDVTSSNCTIASRNLEGGVECYRLLLPSALPLQSRSWRCLAGCVQMCFFFGFFLIGYLFLYFFFGYVFFVCLVLFCFCRFIYIPLPSPSPSHMLILEYRMVDSSNPVLFFLQISCQMLWCID